jgi:hypothetical protein
MTAKQWALAKLICFAEVKPDGEYFSEIDYQYLYKMAPNIQSAFEALSKAIVGARKEIKARLEQSQKYIE